MSLSFSGCRNQERAANRQVEFIDRNANLSLDRKSNPLLLVVGLNEEGRLNLNKIETGTINDTSILAAKLKVVFDDRERSGIAAREVVIDPPGNVKSEDLEKLIETVAKARAAPIRVIRGE